MAAPYVLLHKKRFCTPFFGLYGDTHHEAVALNERINHFFPKWVKKLLVGELIPNLKDNVLSINECFANDVELVAKGYTKRIAEWPDVNPQQVERPAGVSKD
jgi:hypothetical protein